MSITTRDLSVLSYANGFTLWHLKASADTQTEIAAKGYFDPAADLLADGDLVLVSASDGGKLVHIMSDQNCLVATPCA
jgi:hypothetical protein